MFPTPRTPPTHGHATYSPVPADLRTAAPSRLPPSIGRILTKIFIIYIIDKLNKIKI